MIQRVVQPSALPDLWTLNPISSYHAEHLPRTHLMQILSALLAMSFEKAQGWVPSEHWGWGSILRRRQRTTFEISLGLGGSNHSPSLKNKGLFSILKLLNTAEVSYLLEGNAHERSTFYTIKTHAALWSLLFFLKKGKCNKAICCPWGSVGSITKGRHGAKEFWALPGTYWSPQLPQKAGMVFLDLIRNLWHLAKLKSLAFVCALG